MGSYCYSEDPESMSKDKKDDIINSFEYKHCLKLQAEGHCEGFIHEYLLSTKTEDIANEIFDLYLFNTKIKEHNEKRLSNASTQCN